MCVSRPTRFSFSGCAACGRIGEFVTGEPIRARSAATADSGTLWGYRGGNNRGGMYLGKAMHSLQLKGGPEGLRNISASPTTPDGEEYGFTFPDSLLRTIFDDIFHV